MFKGNAGFVTKFFITEREVAVHENCRNSSEQLNTAFRERTRSAIAKAAGEDISRFSEKTNISVVRINRIFDSDS